MVFIYPSIGVFDSDIYDISKFNLPKKNIKINRQKYRLDLLECYEEHFIENLSLKTVFKISCLDNHKSLVEFFISKDSTFLGCGNDKWFSWRSHGFSGILYLQRT